MGVLIINGATATGNHFPYRVNRNQTGIAVHAYFTGNMSNLAIDIEGRLNADIPTQAPWVQIGQVNFNAAEITAKSAFRFLSNVPVDEIRGNITTYNGTGTVFCVVKDTV